jgi:hypothetical protein
VSVTTAPWPPGIGVPALPVYPGPSIALPPCAPATVTVILVTQFGTVQDVGAPEKGKFTTVCEKPITEVNINVNNAIFLVKAFIIFIIN